MHAVKIVDRAVFHPRITPLSPRPRAAQHLFLIIHARRNKPVKVGIVDRARTHGIGNDGGSEGSLRKGDGMLHRRAGVAPPRHADASGVHIAARDKVSDRRLDAALGRHKIIAHIERRSLIGSGRHLQHHDPLGRQRPPGKRRREPGLPAKDEAIAVIIPAFNDKGIPTPRLVAIRQDERPLPGVPLAVLPLDLRNRAQPQIAQLRVEIGNGPLNTAGGITRHHFRRRGQAFAHHKLNRGRHSRGAGF
ncbi:hypothetical protein L0C21_14680 [Sphingosinicellaceae bacterium A1X5R2]|nr:hypothetical protein [Pedomonas mirosovicensis]MCH8686474.1 hypothetical protein [Pedomonas mirosovicensis]